MKTSSSPLLSLVLSPPNTLTHENMPGKGTTSERFAARDHFAPSMPPDLQVANLEEGGLWSALDYAPVLPMNHDPMFLTMYQYQLESMPNTTGSLEGHTHLRGRNSLRCHARPHLRTNNTRPTQSLALCSLLPTHSYCAGRNVLQLDKHIDHKGHIHHCLGMWVVHRLHTPS